MGGPASFPHLAGSSAPFGNRWVGQPFYAFFGFGNRWVGQPFWFREPMGGSALLASGTDGW
eukprot:4708426-Karenia_brevis.AAC.1